MEIATVIPSYADCPDLERCLRYLSRAEQYAMNAEPSWRLFHHVIYGERVGDGRTWSAVRDREIARCREAALRWGAANSDTWANMMDADVAVAEDYFIMMGNTLPEVDAKCAPVINAETGTFRFVKNDFHASYQIPQPPVVDRTSENLMIRSSAVNRIPVPYYKMENLNEDYELCAVLASLGIKIWVVSTARAIAT